MFKVSIILNKEIDAALKNKQQVIRQDHAGRPCLATTSSSFRVEDPILQISSVVRWRPSKFELLVCHKLRCFKQAFVHSCSPSSRCRSISEGERLATFANGGRDGVEFECEIVYVEAARK